MRKILEEKIQKMILRKFKTSYGLKSEFEIFKIENNSIKEILPKTKLNVIAEYIFDKDGDVIEFIGERYSTNNKYDIINNEKLLISKLYTYKNHDTRLFEYKYTNNNEKIKTYVDNKIITKYKYVDGKLKEIIEYINNEIKTISYEYKDDYTLVYNNNILSYKYNKTNSIFYNLEGEIDSTIEKEFNDNDQLISYNNNGKITKFEYDDNKISKIISDREYLVDYNNNDVIVTQIIYMNGFDKYIYHY